MSERRSGQSDLSPNPSPMSHPSCELSQQHSPPRSLRGPNNPKPRRSARTRPRRCRGQPRRKEAQGPRPPRPAPGRALTTHRAPSWSLDRRSRASAVSSPASQKGQGLRPPDPASCKMKAATKYRHSQRSQLPQTPMRSQSLPASGSERPEVLPLSDGWAREREDQKDACAEVTK